MAEQAPHPAENSSDQAGALSAIRSFRPRVVVVGAGFGGLQVAKGLAKKEVDVLVLNRNNYHGFWPLLYQVATAALDPQSIAYPIRGMVRKLQNVNFKLAEVTKVDFERRLVLTDSQPVEYDYLVLAAGSANSYFGNDALADQTFGLKNLEDAIRLRNHILDAFEQAAYEPDLERRRKLLSFVVIGGGPTGVELSGAFSELIHHVLRKDYPSLEVEKARIILVEAVDYLLAPFPEGLRKVARRQLEKLGVEVKTGKAVDSVENGLITFKDGSKLEAGTIVWAAGVRSARLADELGLTLAHQSRVKVSPSLQIPGHPEVFVVGDMAYLEGFKKDQTYPMVAPVAIQQGRLAAHNILALVKGQDLKDFRYSDKGNMATIGRNSAVVDAFGIKASGYIAWISWLVLHLVTLIGFRNKLIVMANWAYNYVTYDRGGRLILKSPEK